MSTAILIPTFGRPKRLGSVLSNIDRATPEDHETIFIIEDDDTEVKAALKKLGAQFLVNSHKANYAGAINSAIEEVSSYDNPPHYVFAGADDLTFYPGWLSSALSCMKDDIKVVGTNDLGNEFVLAGSHATHYLIDLDYINEVGGTMDQGPGVAMYEGYFHNYTDTEIIGVARARKVFAPCLESIVEHNHFVFGKSFLDATYEKQNGTFKPDEVLYFERKKSWVHLLENDNTV